MKNDAGSEENKTVNADGFMRMLDISPNTFKKLLAEGRVPEPLPLGTRNRRSNEWPNGWFRANLGISGSFPKTSPMSKVTARS
jgi:hypothetical protein